MAITMASSKTLARRNYVEASREVAKTYRIWDIKVAICKSVRKTSTRKRVQKSAILIYATPK